MSANKFLPGANFDPKTPVGGSGHLPAETINELANDPRELTTTVAARGALIPVLYGRRDVPGLVFVHGKSGANLVIGYIWCVGEVDAVEAIYVNDGVLPTGVTATHYLGTPTQGVDPKLAASVAAYNDTLRVSLPGGGKLGLCYSVLTITPGALDGFPRARAVIRGRKVFDPRTGLTEYSANPALMLGDLITNPVFGINRLVTGVAACANWCDTELGGIPGAFRARSAIYIADGRPAEQYLDLLCEYAECLRLFEGNNIKLVPDAPVDLTTAPIIGPSQVIEGSFSLTAESSSDTPTEVELQYTQPPAVASESWALEPVVVRLPGVTEGEVQRVPTSITLDGVYRPVEAANKAQARLNRMQGRLTATWTTLDAGVAHQRGDVFNVRLPARGVDIPVRVENVNLAAAGRYQVSASRYDASHYPNDVVLPGGDGVVPVGAIALLVGTEVPVGWAPFSAADGRFIVGAGGALAVGAAGGSNNTGAWSFSTNSAGEHGAQADMWAAGPGGVNGYYSVGASSVGGHSHSVTLADTEVNLLRRANILIIKTGAADIELPPAVRVFGLPNTNTTAVKITAFASRLLQAASVAADLGASTTVASASTGYAGAHVHTWSNYGYNVESIGGQPFALANYEHEGHRHNLAAVLTVKPKKQQLCAFGDGSTYAIRAGMIFMWSGSLGAIPPDYVLCDGTKGTPDMRDRYAEFASVSPAPATGDNTISASGQTEASGHSHNGGVDGRSLPAQYTSGHSEVVTHAHAINASKAFTPVYYALAFIMYAPAG